MKEYSVSISGDHRPVTIGANSNYTNDSNSGNVRIYRRNESDAWNQLGDGIHGEAENDSSECPVSFSGYGKP